MASDDSHLKNLEQWVVEEKKIITYKWLSLTLEVPGNVSKQMLWEFLQQHKDVSSVYFVSGWDTKQQRHIAALITDSDVPGVKDRFAPVMSLHVYAVGMELPKDSAHLWQIDHELKHAKFREAVLGGQDAPTETWSSIKCEGVGLRDRAVARKLEAAAASLKPAYEAAPFIPIGSRSNSAPISDSSKPVSAASSTKKASSTGRLEGMFAKQQTTTSDVPKPEPEKKKSSGGLQSFFGKKSASKDSSTAAPVAVKAEPKPEAPTTPPKATSTANHDDEDDILNELESKIADDTTPKKRASKLKKAEEEPSPPPGTQEDATPTAAKKAAPKKAADKKKKETPAKKKQQQQDEKDEAVKPAESKPRAEPQTLEDELELELESQAQGEHKVSRLRKGADVEDAEKEEIPAAGKKKRGKAAKKEEEAAEDEEEGVDGEKKPKKRKRKAEEEDGDKADAGEGGATEKKKPKTKPKKEPEATEQQKKFGSFFSQDKNADDSESQSPQPSLVPTGAAAGASPSDSSAPLPPVKRTKKIFRKEKVIETFLDEEGFEVRREVEKTIEEEVEVEDEPKLPAASQSQSSSSHSQSQSDGSVKKPPAKSAGHQAKLASFFGKK